MTAVALLLGLCAAVEDLVRRRISNWLVLSGLLLGLALHAGSLRSFALSLAGAAAGFLILLPIHLLGGMGGGDVKLMAAFGALLGPSAVLLAALLAAIVGAVGAALWYLCSPRTVAIPFAPAIVLGAWATWFGGM